MTGIIPEDEDELEQEVYDDVGAIDEDIYEELPGTNTHFILWQSVLYIWCRIEHGDIECISLVLYIFLSLHISLSTY